MTKDVFVFDHPLLQHKLTMIRKKETGSKEFRELVQEVSSLMAYEMTKSLPLEEVEIETPITKTKSFVLSGKTIAIVPLMRAGLGMVNGILNMIPVAKVAHVGLYRDPDTLEAVEYYAKFPKDISEREIFIVDPMLATGGTAIAAIQALKNREAKNINFICLIASPEGISAVQNEFPDVQIFTAAIDPGLNEKSYITPGFGDAGDRLFGTK
ncbi:uracil phosphoribosyltransferase [Alkalibacterium putridalgicola]|uniref:Uracil phosphoribosyltransferase n=1 Tax=Alkalibacterium putridalgicola TaxID=426703 RepID=A0A1H7USM8_9LACT|nr:uracil phosphoribosyltransferase [Alkalibacterium putridalgicola]GEK88497.1 uracil phosphoribosyltransferase [Alkalibacterium putridalgicola]SEL99824.1 uracil phosphoribosyltransferase [Alkalibacterium putridalgicola]